jgi:hypothetical protein
LQRYSVGAADRLEGGEEAEASALGSERVIKFHERTIGRELVGRRREFYAALDSSRVAFRVPVIQRIEGISLAGVLPGLTGLARQRTLRAYAETALAVRLLRHPPNRFGKCSQLHRSARGNGPNIFFLAHTNVWPQIITVSSDG